MRHNNIPERKRDALVSRCFGPRIKWAMERNTVNEEEYRSFRVRHHGESKSAFDIAYDISCTTETVMLDFRASKPHAREPAPCS